MEETTTSEAQSVKRYELMLVLSGKLKDTDVPAAIENVKQAFTKHGARIVDEKVWGRLKFAYEIAHEKTGVYVLWHLDLEPSTTRALEQELRVTDHVLRFMLMVAPKHGAVIEPPSQLDKGERTRPSRAGDNEKGDSDKGDSEKTESKKGAPSAESSIDETLEAILGDEKTA